MNIKKLYLKNIGPFKEETLDFTYEEGQISQVTIITGENGAGKTVILDAIRALFFGPIKSIERNILSDSNDFKINLLLTENDQDTILETTTIAPNDRSTPTILHLTAVLEN